MKKGLETELLCVTEEVVCFKTVYSRGLIPFLQGQLACAHGSILTLFLTMISIESLLCTLTVLCHKDLVIIDLQLLSFF